jgi:hypothetical protein
MKRKKYFTATSPMYEALFGETPEHADSTNPDLQADHLLTGSVENNVTVALTASGQTEATWSESSPSSSAFNDQLAPCA